MHSDSLMDNAEARAFAEWLIENINSDGDFDRLETRLMSCLMEVGAEVMARRFGALDAPETFIEGGRRWSRATSSNLVVHTLFGEVRVLRNLFRDCRNGPSRCLVSERAGLLDGWTPRAAKVALLGVAEMPFGRAETFFREAGVVGVSRSSLLRLAAACSRCWEDNREALEHDVSEGLEIPDEAVSVVVSLDGVLVNLVDEEAERRRAKARAENEKGPAGWKEASVGVLAFFDAHGQRLQTRRYGRMPEAHKATTKAWIAAELERVRARRPDLRTMALADGAANLWSFLETLDADVELVDFFHAVEQLQKHARKALTPGPETDKKLGEFRREMRDEPGGANRAFEEVRRLRIAAGTAPKSWSRESGRGLQPSFDERHRQRLDFPEVRDANLPIGSGFTESTCKLLVCDRLRRTGMRWTRDGGQAVLTFRALAADGRFELGWQPLRERMAA